MRKELSNTQPQKSLDDLEIIDVLPGTDVINAIKNDLMHIIPRILVRYLPTYSKFKKTVIYHIPHNFSNEMELKSDMVLHILYFIYLNSHSCIYISKVYYVNICYIIMLHVQCSRGGSRNCPTQGLRSPKGG